MADLAKLAAAAVLPLAAYHYLGPGDARNERRPVAPEIPRATRAEDFRSGLSEARSREFEGMSPLWVRIVEHDRAKEAAEFEQRTSQAPPKDRLHRWLDDVINRLLGD